MGRLWNWFTKEEVEEDGLKAAVEQNKIAVATIERTSKISKIKASELVGLAQNALDVLDRIEKEKLK